MHAAVFEAGWDSDGLLPQHRAVVSCHYRHGRQVIGVDWSLLHHEYGPAIYGVKKGYDYVEKRYGRFQTVLTATVSNAQRVDGIAVEVQLPAALKAEKAYLKASAGHDYATVEAARERLLELLHYDAHRKGYRKITEVALETVRQLEAEGHFPTADYAFDNGVLNLPLCQFIEGCGKHWVSELESSRNILWQDRWQRIDAVAAELKCAHPESFRCMTYTTRTGEEKTAWTFSKVVRLKRYGRKRILIVHEDANLNDSPRYLIT